MLQLTIIKPAARGPWQSCSGHVPRRGEVRDGFVGGLADSSHGHAGGESWDEPFEIIADGMADSGDDEEAEGQPFRSHFV